MTEFKRREFLKAALAAMAATGVAGCQPRPRPLVPKEQYFKRAELTERLQELARSRPPRNLAPGAMCYRPATPNRCQDCKQWENLAESVDQYKALVERLREQGLDATLVVPELCQTCGYALEQEKFLLEIKYPDHPDTARVELKGSADLIKMELFLQGKDRYDAGQYGEIALKDKVERLRELFGIGEEP
jgi:predicted Zn-ribbon and HTH transcriptional regulator